MVEDIFLFVILRGGGLRHYYQPQVSALIELLDNTYQNIQKEQNLERRKWLIRFTYEIGNAEVIPLMLRQGGKIPNSWQSIAKLYKKYFSQKVIPLTANSVQ